MTARSAAEEYRGDVVDAGDRVWAPLPILVLLLALLFCGLLLLHCCSRDILLCTSASSGTVALAAAVPLEPPLIPFIPPRTGDSGAGCWGCECECECKCECEGEKPNGSPRTGADK